MAEPYHVRLELPLTRLNPADNVHWRVKQREKRELERCIGGQLWGRIPRKPLHFARVLLVRRSSREPDTDNLVSSGKLALDCLVRYRVLEDDSPEHIEAHYRWEKAPRGKGGITLEVWEIEPGEVNAAPGGRRCLLRSDRGLQGDSERLRPDGGDG